MPDCFAPPFRVFGRRSICLFTQTVPALILAATSFECGKDRIRNWRSCPQLVSIHMKESETRVIERIASGRAKSAATRAIEEEEDSPSLAQELSPGVCGSRQASGPRQAHSGWVRNRRGCL